ncbi:MAG TPA: hypothetical protein ENN41_04450, partial [Sediminispirochaeta sp.]|nr:hypothetical protein [Sediminispirochaeta sp.]
MRWIHFIFLLFLGGFTIAVEGEQWERSFPTASYMEYAQREMEFLSERLSASPREQRQGIVLEYRRRLREKFDDLLHRWVQEVEADPKISGTSERLSRLNETRQRYRRDFEELNELLIRRALQSSADPHREEVEELSEYPVDFTDKKSAAQWRDAEHRLLEARLGWEQEVEMRYQEGMEELSREYLDLQQSKREWERQYRDSYLQFEESWESHLASIEGANRRDTELLQQQSMWELESYGGDLSKLLDSLRKAEVLIDQVDRSLLVGEEGARGRKELQQTREESLQLLREIDAGLMELRETRGGAAESLLSLWEALRPDRDRSGAFRELDSGLAKPIGQRPDREEIEARMISARRKLNELQQQYAPNSPELAAAFDEYSTLYLMM